jgi:glucose/arabinose dehydrogenase
MLRVHAWCAVVVAIACASPAAASAAPLQLVPVGTFSQPIFVTAPRTDTARVFVVERPGRIQVLDRGVKHQFLDLTGVVSCCTGERGLASMAFAPDYETSGRFYVQYTAQAPTGAVTVAEYRRSEADPDAADPASGRIVLSIPHDQDPDHNGGQLQFGPDGALYISVGDAGGVGGDPAGNGQNLTSSEPPVVNNANHHPLLGKLLRIDPRSGSPYAVPAANPFPAPAREVYAYGLRNPWRFSFDRFTGDLVVADVGQNAYEEIDFAPAPTRGLGANFGWNLFEALHSYPDGDLVTAPFPAGYAFPLVEKSHSSDGACSITGGYVVRDPALPELTGQYVYGDFCNRALRAVTLTGSGAQNDHAVGLDVSTVAAFGEDACARVYVVSLGGAVSRISNGTPSTCTVPVPTFPAATVSVSDAGAAEGDDGTAPARFVVTLSSTSSDTVTVRHVTTDATATAPADYTSTSGQVTFAPGETSKTVDVPVSGDRMDEDDETFSVELSEATNATIGDGHGVGTIVDDDPAPAVSISGGSVAEGDAGPSTLTYTATLDAPSGKPVTVDFATSDGSAHQPEDYASRTGTLTFAPGETSRRIDVSVAGDTRHENDETVAVGLSNPANGTLGTSQALGTIHDDDPQPALSIADASVTEGDTGATEVQLVVSLSAASGLPVSVEYATSDGSAVAPADYTAASGTLTFAPGVTARTVDVAVIGDTLDEGDETFTLELEAPSGATLQDAAATATIQDDDALPAVSVGAASVAEGGSGVLASPVAPSLERAATGLVFAIELPVAAATPVSVHFATADGTARAPADYQATSGDVTFAPGQTLKTVTVPVSDDQIDEPDETLTLELSAPVNATLDRSRATGTIEDDDAPPAVSIADVRVPEGNAGLTTASLAVSLSGPSEKAISVQYATADGTAQAPRDYHGTSGTLMLAPGQTSGQVDVPIVGDVVDEDDQTFLVGLSAPVATTVSRGEATGTIADDDAPPAVSVGDASALEGDAGTSPMHFAISLSAASEKVVSVRFATSDGSAKAGSDYVPGAGGVTFAPGETRREVTVGVTGDEIPELDESLSLGAAGATGTGTILDDDPAANTLRTARSVRLNDLFCRSGRACAGISVETRYESAGKGTWTFESRAGKSRIRLGTKKVTRRAAGRGRTVFRLSPGKRSAALRRRVLRQRNPVLHATLRFRAASGKRATLDLRMRLRR